MEPTPFQKKMWWAALTALAFVALGATIALLGTLVIRSISFLQPVLTPVAIAGILAYLLEPAVRWLERRRLSRTKSVVVVFLVASLLVAGIFVWVAPALWKQGNSFVSNFPSYATRAQNLVNNSIANIQKFAELPIFKQDAGIEEGGNMLAGHLKNAVDDVIAALQSAIPGVAVGAGRFVQAGIGGFLGVFGTLLSMVLVPIFLFFFLNEGPAIASGWSNYLPLRASPLKSEIVSLLSEINSYLINFFRGQLLVSMIDGTITGILLLMLGLDFALLIGLMVAVLGIIPYAGIIISWFPAVLISAAQFGDWWHPIWVTVIFLAVNNLDGIFIAPKIVGESVGLHPFTVIFSVLAWSLILGGLLGALLAIPLTATLKVVLKRYFWDKPATLPSPPASLPG